MWDLIVSVPDHCLSFYFLYYLGSEKQRRSRGGSSQGALGARAPPCVRVHVHSVLYARRTLNVQANQGCTLNIIN